ncbi:competence type IV pilus minor pilin ComGF [Virgibacillus kekensis]|uniref:Competence type IV pilus minor pilin ComGF n=1 Tax=Virgibacillus kekensis TaxID=202261 RepID=A0ABV9DL48_9BACI
MGVLLNNRGFTFISVFLMITFLFMAIPFTTYLTKGVNYSTNYGELSLQQFYLFLREDVMRATNMTVTPSKIILNHFDGSVVTVEKYQNLIRRQIDGKGHEIYLRNVHSVTFTSSPLGFKLSVTSTEGEHFEKEIIFYH